MRLVWILFTLVFLAGCGGTTTESTPAPTPSAATIIGWAREHFGSHSLGAPRYHGVARADVELSARASGGFSLHDTASGARIRVSSTDTSNRVAQRMGDYVVYRETPGGPRTGDAIYRVHAEGVEDYVFVMSRSDRPEMVYTVELGDGIVGLRFVSDTIEFVSADGAPRLRMARPYLVDAAGTRHAATADIAGCAVDRDPRAPWGRAPVDPGARRCEVSVRWDEARVVYPVLVDPSWTTTTSLSQERWEHTVTRLADGKVLVTGGHNGPNAFRSAEIFDPASHTWAMTGDLIQGRYWHSAARLHDGRVLVISGGAASTSVEIYDPLSGTFENAAPINTQRYDPTATTLNDGRVLIVGGGDCCFIANKTSTLFDPSTGTWSEPSPLEWWRARHSATLLDTGEVLIAGTQVHGDGQWSAAKFNPVTNQWAPTTGMNHPRYEHAAGRLADGRVIVAGGGDGSVHLDTAEIFDPVTEHWTDLPKLSRLRFNATAQALSNGRFLLVGGEAGSPNATAEIFDPVSFQWYPAGHCVIWRARGQSAIVASDTVLLAGMNPSELFSPAPQGSSCGDAGECASLHCVDGFCCDSACGAPCSACSAALKTSGLDGVCGPAQAGTDPHDDCADDGASTCQQNGLCDGQGACGHYPISVGCSPLPCAADAECTSGFCVDGFCCDSGCDGKCDACSGARQNHGLDGICGSVPGGDGCPSVAWCDGAHTAIVDGVEVNCSPFGCNEEGCRADCGSSADCAAGYQCDTSNHCATPGSEGTGMLEGGCACSAAGRSRIPTSVFFAVAALIELVRRCRRPTRSTS